MIVEKDNFAGVALEQMLMKKELNDFCSVVNDIGSTDNIYLYIKDKQNVLPSGISIKQSDQFEKPLRIGALLDRIYKYINAKNIPIQDHILLIGIYELDSRHNTLKHRQTNAVIRLTDKETHILQYLANSAGAFVERQALLDEVWGYAQNVETHTLETHIYRLRQKIEKNPAKPELLITIERGYKLNI